MWTIQRDSDVRLETPSRVLYKYNVNKLMNSTGGPSLLVRGIRQVVRVRFAAVIMGRYHVDRLFLLRLEQFLSRQKTGHDQSDCADQKCFAGQRGDQSERHRSQDCRCHHRDHHNGLLH